MYIVKKIVFIFGGLFLNICKFRDYSVCVISFRYVQFSYINIYIPGRRSKYDVIVYFCK